MENDNTYETHGIYGVRLGHSGNQYVPCPKCSADRKKKNVKCLSVNVGAGEFKCHHCGKFGGLGIGWKNDDGTVNKPIHDFQREIKPHTPPERKHQTNLTDKQIDWFSTKRGISLSTLERNSISTEFIWMPQLDGKADAVCFNFFEGDEVVNVKYRDGKKNFRQSKDGKKTLYKINDITNQEKDENGKTSAIIVEGEMDALSYEEVGLKNCVSIPDGAPNPKALNLDTKFDYLINCAEVLESIDIFYISVDNDEAGLFLKEELCRRLGRHKCYIVTFPDGCKDPNEVLVKLGEKDLLECYANAKPYPIEDIIRVNDFEDEIDKLFNQGLDGGMKVGFDFSDSDKLHSFDKLISFKLAMFMAITGVPSHGKSNFAEQIIMLLNVKYGWKAGIFSPEHYPMELMFSRNSKMFVGKPFFEGKSDRMTVEELGRSKKHLNDNYFYIRPKGDKFSLNTVLEAAASVILKFGVKIILIDPWNTITHDKNGKSDTDYTEEALNMINEFKQRYGVLVIVVAHPTKMNKKKDSEAFEVPNLYSISGSAHWYNKCDYGATVYRDFERELVQVHIQKVKFEHLGQIGLSLFKWNHMNSRYYPKGSEPMNAIYKTDGKEQNVISIKPEEKTVEMFYSNPEDDDDSDLPF